MKDHIEDAIIVEEDYSPIFIADLPISLIGTEDDTFVFERDYVAPSIESVSILGNHDGIMSDEFLAIVREPDRFVSPCPLPTPYEAEILDILIEECAEVIQRATKLKRFGRDEIQPGQPLSNAERLSLEIGDLIALTGMTNVAGLSIEAIIRDQIPKKIAKVQQFLQSEAPK